MENIANKVTERFLKYVTYDTQSDPDVETNPSTQKQFLLAQELKKELEVIGFSNVTLSEHCYVMAEIPATTSKPCPTIGFVAHMDTASEMPGAHVKPRIVHQYDGADIPLNPQPLTILSPNDFPELLDYIGQDLIVTDGTTILGADNKAGIAEIITACEYLLNNPKIPHGTIKIAFTPDEEVGRGTLNFDLEQFDADFAYTVDGGKLGELEYETFNAAEAKIFVQGRNIHPGTAKNRMINAQKIGFELHSLLPSHSSPEHTEGYEGFYHLLNSSGDVESFQMSYIIRDHDFESFERKKQFLQESVSFLNHKYGPNIVQLSMRDQYYNMCEKIKPVFHIVDTAESVMKKLDIQPIIKPVRGGTDGSALSLKGLPTPNLFSGGHNYHGKYEFIPIPSMEKAIQVIIGIVQAYAS